MQRERTALKVMLQLLVDNRDRLQVGQLVRSGSPLMSVVPVQAVYIVANFKETQIESIRPARWGAPGGTAQPGQRPIVPMNLER